MGSSIMRDTVNQTSLRDVFDAPKLLNRNGNIVDGLYGRHAEKALPFAPFTAQCFGYSLILGAL